MPCSEELQFPSSDSPEEGRFSCLDVLHFHAGLGVAAAAAACAGESERERASGTGTGVGHARKLGVETWKAASEITPHARESQDRQKGTEGFLSPVQNQRLELLAAEC